jgi:protein transport protein SEC61 subunit gamma and related proteins
MKAPKEYWVKLRSFTKECVRVLKITRKPNMEEFKTVSKITGLGMLVIGAIGFIIHTLGLLLGI